MAFIYRFIKHLAILLTISLPLQIIGSILILIYLPLHKWLQKQKLPILLRWFDSADIYQQFGRTDKYYIEVIYPASFWTHYTWLCWRNPINYFSYKYLGYQVSNINKIITNKTITSVPVDIATKIEIGDNSYKYPGLQITEVEINNKTYYEYYYIKTYNFLGTKKCLRFRLGYKIGLPSKIQIGEWTQQVFVISPFHSYNGF